MVSENFMHEVFRAFISSIPYSGIADYDSSRNIFQSHFLVSVEISQITSDEFYDLPKCVSSLEFLWR